MSEKQRGFWEELGKKRFAPGEGVAKPPPQGGWRRFFFVLGTHFWKLVSLNLLFLAFSIPMLTIPAALCGMNRVLIKLYREGNCFVWTEFFKEFRANLWKALPFGVLGGIGLFAAYYFLSIGTSALSDHVEPFTVAIGVVLLVFTVLLVNYVFVFLPSLELRNGQIARNALIFVFTAWKTNLVIVSSALFFVLLAVIFYPYSILLVVFLAFALQHYIICVAVNEPLQRRIIGPSEEKSVYSAEDTIYWDKF